MAIPDFKRYSAPGVAQEACGSTAGPERTPEVMRMLKELEEEIATLGSVADDIAGRVEPLLSDRPPSTADKEGPSACGNCKLGENLRQRIEAIRTIRERLADVYQRIEL